MRLVLAQHGHITLIRLAYGLGAVEQRIVYNTVSLRVRGDHGNEKMIPRNVVHCVTVPFLNLVIGASEKKTRKII